MQYLEELADLRYLLDELNVNFERFELAAKSIEVAARSDAKVDARATRDLEDLLHDFERTIDRARLVQGRLVEVMSLLEDHREPEDWIPADEARAIVEEVSKSMDGMISLWRRVIERIRVELLHVEERRGPKGPPRWSEHWPVDADLVQAIVGGLLTEERDQLMLQLYYGYGRSQKDVAQALGVSQPTVASRLSAMEANISLEVALRRLNERFQDVEVQAPRNMRRDGFFRAVLQTPGQQTTVVVLPSDRLVRKPPPRLDFSRVGQVDYIGVYLLRAGTFCFRPGEELGRISVELPFDDEEEVVRAFGIGEEEILR